MIRSMTGYGASSLEDDKIRQSWEIKSVNGKQLNLRWRIPGCFMAWEQIWEKQVRRFARRGRVEIYLNVEFLDPYLAPTGFNTSLARSMLQQLESVARDEGHEFIPDYNRLLNVGLLWKESTPREMDALFGELECGLTQALENWNAARLREGLALQTDLLARVDKLEAGLKELELICPKLASKKFSLLQDRLALLTDGLDLEQERLLQEFAILADRLDVSEELTRLRTHLQSLRLFLSADSVEGKRLDFLLQECFREVNTCGNKAQDITVSQVVVDLKTELEKCREQVQNIE